MLDWLIVGGGMHGVHHAVRLIARGLDVERLCLVDPAPSLLASWRGVTRTVGMAWLRSPAVHHLHPDPFDLLAFARARGLDDAFLGPRRRPSLSLFDAHCDDVIARFGLVARHQRARMYGVQPRRGGFRVHTDRGEIDAARVLVAVGSGDAAWPGWARAARDAGARITHLLEPEATPLGGTSVAVIGGGLSAVQLALALACERPGQVSLIARHPVRVHAFDADPVWLGPRALRRFHQEPRPAARREAIDAARHRGSLPDDVAGALEAAVRAGHVHYVVATSIAARRDGEYVEILADGLPVRVDRAVLATGFDALPRAPFLDTFGAELGLPRGPAGYPVISPTLEWTPGLHLSGALAELELGPNARNLAGARAAATRLEWLHEAAP